MNNSSGFNSLGLGAGGVSRAALKLCIKQSINLLCCILIWLNSEAAQPCVSAWHCHALCSPFRTKKPQLTSFKGSSCDAASFAERRFNLKHFNVTRAVRKLTDEERAVRLFRLSPSLPLGWAGMRMLIRWSIRAAQHRRVRASQDGVCAGGLGRCFYKQLLQEGSLETQQWRCVRTVAAELPAELQAARGEPRHTGAHTHLCQVILLFVGLNRCCTSTIKPTFWRLRCLTRLNQTLMLDTQSSLVFRKMLKGMKGDVSSI